MQVHSSISAEKPVSLEQFQAPKKDAVNIAKGFAHSALSTAISALPRGFAGFCYGVSTKPAWEGAFTVAGAWGVSGFLQGAINTVVKRTIFQREPSKESSFNALRDFADRSVTYLIGRNIVSALGYAPIFSYQTELLIAGAIYMLEKEGEDLTRKDALIADQTKTSDIEATV